MLDASNLAVQQSTHAEAWFNKVAIEPDWNHTLTWMFSSKFAAYFPNTFSEEHLSMAGSAV